MKNWLILFASSCLLFSCSKEEDPIPPTIQMTSPQYLDQYNAIDTILLQGQINDDKAIERITISLKDASNGSLVKSTWAIYPSGKNYALDLPYYLDDINLASGSYYFDIRAYDEVNNAKAFIDIIINGVPKQKLGILFADNSAGSNNIHLLDNGLNVSNFGSYPGNLTGMSVDGFNQELILAPKSSGDMRSVDLTTAGTNWNESLNWDVTAFYRGDNYSYIGMEDGSIKRYNSSGLSNYHGNSNVNFYVEYITQHENYLVMEEQTLSASTVILALRWVASGVTAQQLTVNEDIIGAYSLSSNELVLITNNTSQLGNLLFYDISLGSTSNPFAINTAKIDACVEIQTGVYLVAENGQLTTIDANGFSTSTYMAGTNANQLYYDESSNELVIVDGNTITVYNYSSKSLIGSYTHSSPIAGLTFWYNKD